MVKMKNIQNSGGIEEYWEFWTSRCESVGGEGAGNRMTCGQSHAKQHLKHLLGSWEVPNITRFASVLLLKLGHAYALGVIIPIHK